jgi:DNA-binding FadR family transcriptional regulator
MQVSKAVREVAKSVAANGWLDPTPKEYRQVVEIDLGKMRLTTQEREKLTETLIELRDEVVRASYKIEY